MQVIAEGMSVEKSGNRPGDNEDAFQYRWVKGRYSRTRRFCCSVADGATQTSFSRIWARLLVEYTTRRRCGLSGIRLWKQIARAQQAWTRHLGSINLPWHAEEKVKRGAFATLLCLQITKHRSASVIEGPWEALAIGDSCLLHCRSGQLISSFPLQHSSEFNNAPLLLSSRSAPDAQTFRDLDGRLHDGTWQVGDEFILATDAMAAWILTEHESARSPVSQIADVLQNTENPSLLFQEWVKRQRAVGALRNDDTTCVWIRILE